MGRNYFSKHGGPYFINNGLSKHHDHSHDDPNHIKPDKGLFIYISIGFVLLLSTLYVIAISL